MIWDPCLVQKEKMFLESKDFSGSGKGASNFWQKIPCWVLKRTDWFFSLQVWFWFSSSSDSFLMLSSSDSSLISSSNPIPYKASCSYLVVVLSIFLSFLVKCSCFSVFCLEFCMWICYYISNYCYCWGCWPQKPCWQQAWQSWPQGLGYHIWV